MRHLASIALLLALPISAQAVPMELSHQGRLLDSIGVPLDGDHDLAVSIWDDPAAGNSLWSEIQTVPFDAGYFQMQLGADSTNPLEDDDFPGTTLWLEIGIDGAPPLSRLSVQSVPYAIRARSVAGGTVDVTEIMINGTTVIDSTGAITGSTDWSTVTNVPVELTDGDDDTLAALTCNPSEVPQWDGSAWGCTSLAVAHQHNAIDIDSGVLDLARLPIGAGSTNVAVGDHGHTNVDAVTLQGQGASAFAASSHGHAFSDLSGAAVAGQLPIGTTASDVAAGNHAHTAASVGALAIGGGTLTGSLVLGDDSTTCSSSNAGALRWTGTTLDVCINDVWTDLVPTTGPSAPTAGLLTWVKADAGVTFSSGTNISSWADQSSNGNDWVQGAGARQPNLVANQLNGLPVIRHTAGSADTLVSTTNYPAPVTVIYVARQNSGANARILSGVGNNWLLGWWNGAMNQAYHNGWVTPAGTPGSDGNWHMYSSVMTGSNSTIYNFRSQVVSGAGGVQGPNGLNTNGHLSTSEHSNCDVAEVLVYNGALSASQLDTVWTYLEGKWGI